MSLAKYKSSICSKGISWWCLSIQNMFGYIQNTHTAFPYGYSSMSQCSWFPAIHQELQARFFLRLAFHIILYNLCSCSIFSQTSDFYCVGHPLHSASTFQYFMFPVEKSETTTSIWDSQDWSKSSSSIDLIYIRIWFFYSANSSSSWGQLPRNSSLSNFY